MPARAIIQKLVRLKQLAIYSYTTLEPRAGPDMLKILPVILSMQHYKKSLPIILNNFVPISLFILIILALFFMLLFQVLTSRETRMHGVYTCTYFAVYS